MQLAMRHIRPFCCRCAEKIGLDSFSQGFGEERHVTLYPKGQAPAKVESSQGPPFHAKVSTSFRDGGGRTQQLQKGARGLWVWEILAEGQINAC